MKVKITHSAIILVVFSLAILLHCCVATNMLTTATKRIKPDTILDININFKGYVDKIVPFSDKQDGFFIVGSGPNEIISIDSSNQAETFLMNISLASKWITMGSVETCVGGLFTPQYNLLNLVYSGKELGKSYIVQVNLKNLTQIVEVISLGANSQVLDVFENRDLNVLHILVKKGPSLSLFTFDPKDNLLKEQSYPFMTTGKIAYMKDTGLFVGIGNSTTCHLLLVDARSLKIIYGDELDSFGIYEFQSLSCTGSLISVVYSKITTRNTVYMYDESKKQFYANGGLFYNSYKRFSKCNIISKGEKVICVDNNSEMVSIALTTKKTDDYYPLESAENNLLKSFTQMDDEGQLLLYVPQTYSTDDDSFRIGVYNYAKFE